MPPWQVLLMLGPLLVPALLAYQVRPRSFITAAVRVWPPAAFAVYLASRCGLGNEPMHSFLGISIPLAILAAQGIGTVRWPARASRRTLATLAVLTLTVPQGVSELAGKWRYVRASANSPTRSDWQAVGYLSRDPQPGGVLAGFALGRYIPAETGRRTYVGDVFWSEPDSQTRERNVSRLLAGRITPAQAQSFVSRTGARFLLSDCTVHANLGRDLAPIIHDVHRFGCATVYELRPASDHQR